MVRVILKLFIVQIPMVKIMVSVEILFTILSQLLLISEIELMIHSKSYEKQLDLYHYLKIELPIKIENNVVNKIIIHRLPTIEVVTSDTCSSFLKN